MSSLPSRLVSVVLAATETNLSKDNSYKLVVHLHAFCKVGSYISIANLSKMPDRPGIVL